MNQDEASCLWLNALQMNSSLILPLASISSVSLSLTSAINVSPSLEDLRMAQMTSCAAVQQYSGYLDIAQDKHLFFWYALSAYLLGLANT